MSENHTEYGLFINDFYIKDGDSSLSKKESKTCYRLCLGVEGEGLLNSPMVNYTVKKGYIFMILPHHKCAIENVSDFKYIAIEFMGPRGVVLAKGLLDYSKSPVFENYNHLIDMWKNTLSMLKNGNKTLLAEGLLLYTLGSIPGKGILKGEFKKRESILIQTYIHNNFNNPNLTLELVAKKFGYNKKYLSDMFKKKFDIGFTEFVRDVRLKNAVSLMELGNTSITRISELSGFSDPLYFSKLFKVKYGMSPKSYISKLK